MRLLGTVRPQFLMLTPACVVLGVSTAIHSGTRISWLEIIFVLPGATLAHVAVNVFNEFHDFRSGLDSHTRRTPFSGGSGTLQAHPGLAGAALTVGIAATVGGVFPPLSLIGFATLPLSIASIQRAASRVGDTAGFVPALGLNVVVVLATPVLVAAGEPLDQVSHSC